MGHCWSGIRVHSVLYGVCLDCSIPCIILLDSRSACSLAFFFEVFLPFLYGISIALILLNVGRLELELHPLIRGVSQFILSAACFAVLIPRLNKKYSLFADAQAIPLISRFINFTPRNKRNG